MPLPVGESPGRDLDNSGTIGPRNSMWCHASTCREDGCPCVDWSPHYIAVTARQGIHMNLDKFTERAKGFLQAAQTVAIRMNHQRITPAHLLKALLEDDQGMAAGLIARAGGSAEAAVREVDEALAKMPAVS